MKRLLAAGNRALADYSLRRFLRYAANPLCWPLLASILQAHKNEMRTFSKSLAQWQWANPRQITAPHYFFRDFVRPNSFPSGLDANMGAADPDSPDLEIRMRFDRLGWALEGAMLRNDAIWAEVGHWIAARGESGLAHSDSYTLSERISNLILLWNLFDPPEPLAARLLCLLNEDSERILSHPEYHGESATNNHIINNARALILAGAFLDCDDFYNAGRWILNHQLHKHIATDGIVREASSHYQWVISRWLVEILCVFRRRDGQAFDSLSPLVGKMLDVCDSMLLGSLSRNYLPLVGDISPDFPPNFYGGLTSFGRLVLKNDRPAPVAKLTAAQPGFWARFFAFTDSLVVTDWCADDCSWARMIRGPWAILTHADTHPDDDRSSHGHHDLFSFELAWDGIPLVIDPGRRSYFPERDSEEAGVLEEWHNTFYVDNVRTGFIPRGYMPKSWLSRFRLHPYLELDQTCLSIHLTTPVTMPGISKIHRAFSVTPHGSLRIRNRIRLDFARQASVTLVLYVQGKVQPADGGLAIEIGEAKFLVRYQDLGTPHIRPATRYIAYDTPRTCCRIEWNVTATGPQWEADIEFSQALKMT